MKNGKSETAFGPTLNKLNIMGMQKIRGKM